MLLRYPTPQASSIHSVVPTLQFMTMRKLLQRSVNGFRHALMGMGASSWLLRHGLLGLVETRRYFSAKYLRGHGIEIGALGNPLPLSPGVSAYYVDRVPREESQRIYPDASSNPHIEPDRVEDGFALPSFAADSLDFVIGNHVLEHAPNFFGALSRWTDVIRVDGHIFAAVPLANECFDRKRSITDPVHFLEDYQCVQSGRISDFERNTLDHCREYLSLSCPEIHREMGRVAQYYDAEELERRACEMMAGRVDMHYHTFSLQSMRNALELYMAAVRNNVVIAAIERSRLEIVFVLKKIER